MVRIPSLIFIIIIIGRGDRFSTVWESFSGRFVCMKSGTKWSEWIKPGPKVPCWASFVLIQQGVPPTPPQTHPKPHPHTPGGWFLPRIRANPLKPRSRLRFSVRKKKPILIITDRFMAAVIRVPGARFIGPPPCPTGGLGNGDGGGNRAWRTGNLINPRVICKFRLI